MECLVIRVERPLEVSVHVLEVASDTVMKEFMSDVTEGRQERPPADELVAEIDARVRIKLSVSMAMATAAKQLGPGKRISVFAIKPYESDGDLGLEITLGIDPKTTAGVETAYLLQHLREYARRKA